MRPCPPACYRAVHPQPTDHSNSVWISDDLLSNVFARFCSLPRNSRRHGSFVPGPLEARRRRLGARRMTHVSNGVPSTSGNIGSISGWIFGDIDRTKWQWQAPTSRQIVEKKPTSSLPTWLLEWDSTSFGNVGNLADNDPMPEKPFEKSFDVEEDIHQFRAIMKRTTCSNVAMEASKELASKLRMNTRLGIISQGDLLEALCSVSEVLRASSSTERFTDDLCLAFYTQVWDGIVESKVLQPGDLDGKLMNKLFSLLVSLPLTPGVKGLARIILDSANDFQLRQMVQGILSLVVKWTFDWRSKHEVENCIEELQYAKSLVEEAQSSVIRADRLTYFVGMDKNNLRALPTRSRRAQKALSNGHIAVMLAMDATIDAQDALFPLHKSVKDLARVLATLPPGLLQELIPEWTDRLLKPYTITARNPMASLFAYNWLCVIARLPNVDFKLLINTWRRLDPERNFCHVQCCQVILEHWISHGQVAEPSAVRNAFDCSLDLSKDDGSTVSAKLLSALSVDGEVPFGRTKDFLRTLRKLRRPVLIGSLLSQMRKLNMKIPTASLARARGSTSADTALIERASHVKKVVCRRDHSSLLPIVQLIDSRTKAGKIWDLLGIPIYEKNRKYKAHKGQLPRDEIDLIHKMAMAFAHSDHRSPRVAFRHITQCLHHLRIHNAHVSPELTRAIVHCYVTKSILSGQFVGQQRLRYCLYLVSRVEGENIAEKVDQTVFRWRRLLTERRTTR